MPPSCDTVTKFLRHAGAALTHTHSMHDNSLDAFDKRDSLIRLCASPASHYLRSLTEFRHSSHTDKLVHSGRDTPLTYIYTHSIPVTLQGVILLYVVDCGAKSMHSDR